MQIQLKHITSLFSHFGDLKEKYVRVNSICSKIVSFEQIERDKKFALLKDFI